MSIVIFFLEFLGANLSIVTISHNLFLLLNFEGVLSAFDSANCTFGD